MHLSENVLFSYVFATSLETSLEIHNNNDPIFLIIKATWRQNKGDTWVAQLVGHQIPGFSSGHDL